MRTETGNVAIKSTELVFLFLYQVGIFKRGILHDDIPVHVSTDVIATILSVDARDLFAAGAFPRMIDQVPVGQVEPGTHTGACTVVYRGNSVFVMQLRSARHRKNIPIA